MSADPQKAIQEYNKKEYIYTNKNSILGLLALAALALIILIYFTYTSEDSSSASVAVLPPRAPLNDWS